MVEDPKWELAILATVQGFAEKLLQEPVEGEVPVPAGLEAVALQSGDNVHETLLKMRRWLRLMDMAISPAMLRRAFTSEVDPEIAEAMLRYFIRKKESSDVHRDKTDLVATFLYRHPRVPGQWHRSGYGLDGSLPLSPFEIALLEILADNDTPELPEEHVQLLRRFDPLQEEAASFSDLNALLESGIIPRVRELKQSLEGSFYHPGVLATIASYNAAFGKIFDGLFHQAAAEIRAFAEALQAQGGSILGNVDGIDVTVEHVAALEDGELLRIDYSNALDKFRRVSKLKRALDRRPPIRKTSKSPLVSSKARAPERVTGLRRERARPGLDVQRMRTMVTPQQISSEEGKLLRVEESIRVFVRVADPKYRQVVPMRFFNLTLSAAEADAYCAAYLQEKSLRAGVARVLFRIVAVNARMSTELEELKRSETSPALWKLHADSLLALLEVARAVNENSGRVVSLATQHKSDGDAQTIRESLHKLRERAELVVETLASGSPDHHEI